MCAMCVHSFRMYEYQRPQNTENMPLYSLDWWIYVRLIIRACFRACYCYCYSSSSSSSRATDQSVLKSSNSCSRSSTTPSCFGFAVAKKEAFRDWFKVFTAILCPPKAFEGSGESSFFGRDNPASPAGCHRSFGSLHSIFKPI